MLSLPTKVRRKKQPYIAIRSRLVRRQMERQAIVFLTELRGYTETHGITDLGPAYFRFNAFEESREAAMEFGYFTDKQYSVPYPMRSGLMPGGTFTTTTWHGDYSKLDDVNMLLLGWGDITKVQWENSQLDGTGFEGCRLAIFHKTRRIEPIPDNWITELAILHKATG
jgi:hypothetical protein